MIDALLEYYRKEDVSGDILSIKHPSLSGNCCAQCIFRMEFDDSTRKELYEELPLMGNATINDIILLNETDWKASEVDSSTLNIRDRVEILLRSHEAFLRSEYDGVLNIRSKCVGIINIS